MSRDKSRRILVTGVTRGLGRAMAEKLIAQGHTVIGCGRSRDAIIQMQTLFPSPHHFLELDVADHTQVERWSQQVLADGPVDLLLNNAAVMNRNAPLWKIEAQEFDRLIDINLKGVANCIRAFVPSMVKARHGIIVNFSSAWGRSTSPEVAPYCCSKWGIEGLTRALAQELPPGVAAIALNPGVIDTDMLRSCFGAGAAQYPAPQAWASKAVDFILSFSNKQNGQSLTVPL